MGGGYFRGTKWVVYSFSQFYLKKNHVWVVKFSYLNFAPLNLYPSKALSKHKRYFV